MSPRKAGERSQVLVSVIIPVYQAEQTLALCLDGCLSQSHPDVEVIVVDDGSTDGTPRIARGFAVHYLRQENAGPAAARNRGAREARGEILAFTDADCIPAKDWIERLVAGFDEGVVAVGGTYGIANADSALARVVHEEIALRHSRFGDSVDFLGSFNMACRRDAFEAVGGFDEDFVKASGEDNDLSCRLADAGGLLRFAREARVDHHHPTRLWPYLKTQMDHGFWRMKLYAKHPGRARMGDRYAGLLDFAGPPTALALLACLAFLGLMAAFGVLPPREHALTVARSIGGMALFFLGIRAYLGMGLRVRIGVAALLFAYVPMVCCRDVARGLGMVRGAWHFMILKRETA